MTSTVRRQVTPVWTVTTLREGPEPGARGRPCCQGRALLCLHRRSLSPEIFFSHTWLYSGITSVTKRRNHSWQGPVTIWVGRDQSQVSHVTDKLFYWALGFYLLHIGARTWPFTISLSGTLRLSITHDCHLFPPWRSGKGIVT